MNLSQPAHRTTVNVVAGWLAVQLLATLIWLLYQGASLPVVLAVTPLLAAGHVVFGCLISLILTAEDPPRAATAARPHPALERRTGSRAA